MIFPSLLLYRFSFSHGLIIDGENYIHHSEVTRKCMHTNVPPISCGSSTV
uniref:Uncharacterized protein n=1 Tax=Arundo donax TaxID=35708 RepID=A0A0A9B5R5_ARUDO